MGQIRDELYDTMWDPVFCDKHSWRGSDSRFSCPSCKMEQENVFKERRDKAKSILEPFGLADLVKYSLYH